MALLEEIKRNPEVRRIFGERELNIIKKQLMGIYLKPSEITRLSRDIRKKLDVIKNLARFKSEFKLKKAAYIKKTINKAKELILKNPLSPKVKKIILFGSVAENETRLGSDIDIAVKFDEIDNETATKFRINLLGQLSDIMDIQVYNVLSEKIKKQIDIYGKIIFERAN